MPCPDASNSISPYSERSLHVGWKRTLLEVHANQQEQGHASQQVQTNNMATWFESVPQRVARVTVTRQATATIHNLATSRFSCTHAWRVVSPDLLSHLSPACAHIVTSQDGNSNSSFIPQLTTNAMHVLQLPKWPNCTMRSACKDGYTCNDKLSLAFNVHKVPPVAIQVHCSAIGAGFD